MVAVCNDLLFLALSYLEHKESTKILNYVDPSLNLPLNYFWVDADYTKKNSIRHVVFQNRPKDINQFKNLESVFVNWRIDPLYPFVFPDKIRVIKLNYRNYNILPLFNDKSLIRWPDSFTHLVIDYTQSRLKSLTDLFLCLPKTVQKVTIENASTRLIDIESSARSANADKEHIPEHIKVVEFCVKGRVKEMDSSTYVWDCFDCSLVNCKYIFTRK